MVSSSQTQFGECARPARSRVTRRACLRRNINYVLHQSSLKPSRVHGLTCSRLRALRTLLARPRRRCAPLCRAPLPALTWAPAQAAATTRSGHSCPGSACCRHGCLYELSKLKTNPRCSLNTTYGSKSACESSYVLARTGERSPSCRHRRRSEKNG